MGEIEIFSTRIKELRESLNMTQTQFSGFIGVKQQTLSGYERGIMKPPLDIAKIIAQKCHVSIDWLCGLTDKKQYNEEIETYGDGIRLLLKIEKAFDISLSYDWIKLESFQTMDCVATISFGNDKMQDFIKEWEKMKKVHDDFTIDDDVYNLWIEKTLKKYDEFPTLGDGYEPNKLSNPPQGNPLMSILKPTTPPQE